MPKLSSAATPPEYSSDCLPVRTIALSGVMTRMPLVRISIVASAFQYDWAPTLIPVTTTLTSPPAWVNVIRRRNTRATPVLVLRAAAHGDLGAGGPGQPFHRYPE